MLVMDAIARARKLRHSRRVMFRCLPGFSRGRGKDNRPVARLPGHPGFAPARPGVAPYSQDGQPARALGQCLATAWSRIAARGGVATTFAKSGFERMLARVVQRTNEKHLTVVRRIAGRGGRRLGGGREPGVAR
jgi:hypothetical protein